MITIFKSITKQYQLHKTVNRAVNLKKIGKKEEAFDELISILPQHPYNPYLRRNLHILGEELNKNVILPSHNISQKYIYKL